jgi:hypothetical protein
MRTGFARRAKIALTAAAIAGPALLVSGCYEDEYYAQRDTLTLGAGDAVETNKVTHTVDPWNENAQNTDIHLEGERGRLAVDRYQRNQSIPPSGLNTTSISATSGGAQIKN